MIRDSLPGTLTIYAYGVGSIFGVLFVIALVRTDWYRHPWGRNVLSLMVCLTALEMFAFSRRLFGTWPGQDWLITGLSISIAVIQAWRWWLQFSGNRRQRKLNKAPKEDRS